MIFPYLTLVIGFICLVLLYMLLIRPWQLHWGANSKELTHPMPGDELVIRPSFNATRAVTIHAPAKNIYPWIVQIGVTRAGWYSYDLLDNLGRPSAENILPQHQHIQPGDLIPMSPDGKYGIHVKDFRQDDWILWWDQPAGDTSWAWGIYPQGDGSCRLVTRVRMKYRWLAAGFIFNLLVEFCDIVMMQKCMLGIKRRAEKMA